MNASSVATLLDRIPVIDVDSHVLEPPDLWTSRLPTSWGDAVPRVVADPASGRQRWQVAGKLISGVATHAPAEWHEWFPSRPTVFDEAVLSSWEPTQRLGWMDRHGVHAQVLYPNLLGFHAWAFLLLDEKLRLDCVRAFNDFQTEFCSVAPQRLVPLAYLPWWDIDASVAELERCRAMGHKGINFGCEFEKLGLPPLRSGHFDRILSAAQDHDMPVNFHIGFNNQSEEEMQGAQSKQETLDVAKTSVLFLTGNISCIAELIMGQICHRFPRLKFVSVESGFGYIPYLIEALDWQFQNLGVPNAHPDLLLPSEYFRRQIYGTFWFEKHLVHLLDLYPDNVMFETDFPHATSLSPGDNSVALSAHDTILANLADVPADLLEKVLHGNAKRVYNLD